MDTEKDTSRVPKTCYFCKKNQSKYCCPRCSEQYCSLVCYKSPEHVECTESFYRECVTQEMTGYHADGESRDKMKDILTKLHAEGVETSEFNESPEMIEDEAEYTDLDSDDEQHADLNDRINAINLDNPEEVWNALTEDEKQEFEALVSTGDVTKLIPQWQPWWAYSKETKLVEELKENKQEVEALKLCPKIVNVPELNITTTKPADCVKYNILNVVASYALLMRYFNGDVSCSEMVCCLLDICNNLGKNANFVDEETALTSVEQECVNSTLIETDEASLKVMKYDAYLILRGPSKENKLYYCVCVLSHLHTLLTEAKHSLRKKHATAETKQTNGFMKKFPNHGDEHLPRMELNKIKINLKKIEYYLGYVNRYGLPLVVE